MKSRLFAVWTIIVGFSLLSLPFAAAFSREEAGHNMAQVQGLDRDGDGHVGEETAIRERIKAYIEHHGVDGKLSSRERLRRALYARRMWQEDSHEATTKAIPDGTWINIGPINGAGRASCVAPHPNLTGVILQGAASGGVWKTLDGGTTWYPTTDDLSDLSIGAIAWAPSDADVAYVGTGEGDTLVAGGSGYIPGIGILRSDDGGESWYLPGQENDPVSDVFFALNVDPENDEIVFAATEKGLLRSEDGGTTWQTMIASGSSSYAFTEVLRSASNADLMYTCQWCGRGCADGTSRVMRSTDRGLTWFPIGQDTLDSLSGYTNRAALALAPSDDQILYFAAYVTAGSSSEDPKAGIFRSDDGGDTWVETQLSSTMKPKGYLGNQGWYDNTITINPTNPDIVVAGGIWYVISTNGGQNWTNKNPYDGTRRLPHVDVHDLQYQGARLWVGCDGGVWYSDDDGLTWTDRNDGVVTRQYYGMAIDPINRARVLGGTQDNGTNLRRDADDDTFDFVLGGDGFECAINPMLPNIMYASIYYTQVFRTSATSSSFRNISPYFGEEDAPFITPVTLNPQYPNIVFTGAENLYRSDNGGDSWYKLPVDPLHDVDNGIWSGGEIWAIATTPADPNRIAVSKGSLVYNSADGGKTWSMGVIGSVAFNIDISPFDPDLVLVATKADYDGRSVRRSTDGGRTWSDSGSGLPNFNVQVVRFDPSDADVAFAGTDVGLYRSTDAGQSWQRWGMGLPAAPIHDLRILPDGSMLRVGTYGRGFWELELSRPPNDPPSISISSPSSSSVSLMFGDTLDLEATATDPDGDAITIDWYPSLDYKAIATDSGTGTITSSHTINIDRGGMYSMTARATDAGGLQSLASFSILARDAADSCTTPHVIPSEGPFPYLIDTSNQFGGVETSDPVVPCVDLETSDPDSGRQGSIWFEFTPMETAVYSISTCGSVADTLLSAWTGDACGPYTAIEGACNDDDEQEHCMGSRTDSYLEMNLEAASNYRFMVGSWKAPEGQVFRGQVHFQIDCLTCETEEEGMKTFVSAAAHADGAEGTAWITDLQIVNVGTENAEATITFLPADSDNTELGGIDLRIDAGKAMNLGDVVADFLQSTGAGAIEIQHSSSVLVASRTYNTAESGTFGQFIPGIAPENALPPAESVRFIGLAGNDAFRTNIGCANTSMEDATFSVELYDSEGSLLWNEEETLQPRGWLQLNRVFQAAGLGNQEAANAIITNTSSDAIILPYASVVDSLTGDPTFVTGSSPALPGDPVWIEASAHANGVGSSVWRTDLNLANTGNDPIVATISLLLRDQNNSDPTEVPLTVPAGTSLLVSDILNSLFGITGAAALKIEVDQGELFATSRTYNQAEAGTFGQFIPGFPESSAVAVGGDVVLTSLRQNENFRSNLGLINTTAQTIRVEATFFDGEGQMINWKNYDLQPFSYIQDSRALLNETVLDGGYAIINGNGAFFAYLSMVDNGSDDPIFIPGTMKP